MQPGGPRASRSGRRAPPPDTPVSWPAIVRSQRRCGPCPQHEREREVRLAVQGSGTTPPRDLPPAPIGSTGDSAVYLDPVHLAAWATAALGRTRPVTGPPRSAESGRARRPRDILTRCRRCNTEATRSPRPALRAHDVLVRLRPCSTGDHLARRTSVPASGAAAPSRTSNQRGRRSLAAAGPSRRSTYRHAPSTAQRRPADDITVSRSACHCATHPRVPFSNPSTWNQCDVASCPSSTPTGGYHLRALAHENQRAAPVQTQPGPQASEWNRSRRASPDDDHVGKAPRALGQPGS